MLSCVKLPDDFNKLAGMVDGGVRVDAHPHMIVFSPYKYTRNNLSKQRTDHPFNKDPKYKNLGVFGRPLLKSEYD